MKIRPVRGELFHEDGRTDIKLIVIFRNSAIAPKYNQLMLCRKIVAVC